MNGSFQRFESGWIDVRLALRSDEIDSLIDLLRDLQSGSIEHFHLTRHQWGEDSESEEPGIADVEISLTDATGSNDNLRVG